VVLCVAALAAARFHDGPLGIAPGGPLVAGELVATPVGDWGFATDVPTIELQLDGESSSRTTCLVADGRAFVPASLSFPPGKRWHKTADEKGAAWIRVDGKRYPVQLTRVRDDAALDQRLRGVVGAKYDVGPADGEGGVWFFEVVSRPVS
jgi:hypothetical protein